jgi:hypothetical protein
MTGIQISKERKADFHARLESLLSEFPELSTTPECTCDNPDHTEVDDSPKYLSGVLLVLSYDSVEGFSELFWTAPNNQNIFLTKGMAHATAELI